MFADMLTKASEASQNNSRRASEAFAWPPVHRKKLVSEYGEGSVSVTTELRGRQGKGPTRKDG